MRVDAEQALQAQHLLGGKLSNHGTGLGIAEDDDGAVRLRVDTQLQ